MCAPLCATGGRPAATLAISVAVSRASQIPPLIPTPPKCGMRSAECGMDHPLQFRTPHSAFRTHEALHGLSSELLELAEVRCLNVRQVEVPIERWRPWPRALGPFDQDDGPVAYHVVESQVLRLGRGPEAVAVDVIDHPALGRAVLVDQRVRRTGGGPSSSWMRASRSLASVGRWNPAAAGLAVFASATRVANRTWSTDLTIERGVIPCCSLYASCTSRRRLISSRARCIEPVTRSAYRIARPSRCRAARPTVWMRDRSERRNPS